MKTLLTTDCRASLCKTMADTIIDNEDELERRITHTDENKHTAHSHDFTSHDLFLQQNLHNNIISEGDTQVLLHTTAAAPPPQSEFISDSVDMNLDTDVNTSLYDEFVDRADTLMVEENILGFQNEEEIRDIVVEDAVYAQSLESSAIDEGFFTNELNKFSEKLLRFDEYHHFFEGAQAENQSVVNWNGLELVDDVAMIDAVPLIYNSENTYTKDNESVKFEEIAEEEVKNDNAVDGKKQKRSRRRKKGGANKGLEVSDATLTPVTRPADYTNCCEGRGCKQLYSREELEALRFVNVMEQKDKWCELYSALGPVVAKEYDNLAYSANHKNNHVDFDPRQQFQGNNASCLPEDASSQDVDSELKETKENEKKNVGVAERGRDHSAGEYSDDDGYYDSMHRPAFYVEGEPDFDSGPPEDGLEFLRRVRWEAARIPNVKVVKPDKSKLVKEQTVYMPSIPDIVKCPEHLLPPKQWENMFLSEFEELRLSLPLPEESIPEKSVNGNLGDYPALSTILNMDSVTRLSMLRRRIKSVQAMTSLSKSDCVWLFALCASVDTPFDADMSACVRCLLRKCASLRAEKTELDDEVAMLNILATITGQYFGQAEK